MKNVSETLISQLNATLANFGVSGTIGQIYEGPLITEVEYLLSKGSKFNTVAKLDKDIGRELGVTGVRISEIPNSTYIRFEIPLAKPQTVPFETILQSADFAADNSALPICLGVDMRGRPVLRNLAKMPHLLVAGTTGSGKSVGLNSFIISLIRKKTPKELKLLLIDPKRIEFSMYNNQKYLLQPIITDMSIADDCLHQLCNEMNERYALFEKNMVRNIGEYHDKGLKMPYIVCIIDEFADLIMFNPEVEKQVLMLAQKSRAAGIHLIIATQRPSVDVITGTLKANLPTRLSYKVASPSDSQTILNTSGAEDLIGRGDSLFLEENGTLTRILGAYISHDGIMSILEPYRCEIKFSRQITQTAAPEKSTPAAKPKKSLWIRLYEWWDHLGRRNQTKIINFLVGLVLGTAQSTKTKRRK